MTKNQIIILFTHAEEEAYNKCRTQAIFNGYAFAGKDPEEALSGDAQTVKKETRKSQQSLPDQSSIFPVFESPDKYKHLSKEEKESLTDRMMKAHKIWAQTDSAMTDFGKD